MPNNDIEFVCALQLDRPLEAAHADYLRKFAETRHCRRLPAVADYTDTLRERVGLDIGPDGAFFTGDPDTAMPVGVLDENTPASGVPSMFCPWTPEGDGEIGWTGAPGAVAWASWLAYLVRNFLKPWGYTLDGDAEWYGADDPENSYGRVVVLSNRVGVRLPERGLGPVSWL